MCRHGIRFDFLKVLDFGLVALAPEANEGDGRLTAEGTVGCTPAYVAPEMVDGREVDGRTDLYALGCVAYWLLAGRPPFEGRTPLATIVAHVSEKPTPPSAIAELEIPPALEQIVMACLEKDPEARPASAEALAQRIEEAIPPDAWPQARARKWWQTHRPKLTTEGSFAQGNVTIQFGGRARR